MATPQVFNLSPPFGDVKTPTPPPVTITGTGFLGATAVNFGPGRPVPFIVINDTTIQVPDANAPTTSPAVPMVVQVTVTTPAGTSGDNGHENYYTYQGDWQAYTPCFNDSKLFVFEINTSPIVPMQIDRKSVV